MCRRSGRLVSLLILLGVGVLKLPAALAQESSDPQGVLILTSALNVSGVTNPLRPVQDFTATGTITYFWAGDEVSGPATVRGRFPDLYRVDASLPDGVRSVAVYCPGGKVVGAKKEADGTLRKIPLHNTINLGVLTYPYLSLGAKLNDPLTSVRYVGVVDVRGRKTHVVRVQRIFPEEIDADGALNRLCTKDYFVDAETFLLLKTRDMTHPDETLTEDLEREVEFENYVPVDGVMFPSLVREKIIGQTTWELRLSSVQFNVGLTDVDFALN